MKSLTLALLGLGFVTLTACVSMATREGAPTMWVKPGSTNADLVQDRNACIYDAHKAAPYAAPDSLPVINLAIECLKSKGWRLVPVGTQ